MKVVAIEYYWIANAGPSTQVTLSAGRKRMKLLLVPLQTGVDPP
jgi:hypothetical protein